MAVPPAVPGVVRGAHGDPSNCRHWEWQHVPEQLRRAIDSQVGPVRAITAASAGLNAHIAATLAVPTGKVFVKAIPLTHPSAFTLTNEARIAPDVRGISPRLLHHGTTAGWQYLLFEHVAGRHVDLSPGSSDVDVLADLLRRLAAVTEFDTLAAPPVEQRWARFGRDLDLGPLAGDHLVHSDLNPGNILIDHGRAVLVDWARPARAAAWLSVGFLLASLVSAGAAPATAERWAVGAVPEWCTAAPAAVDTFVAALARRRAEQALDSPPARRSQRQHQARAAQRWLHHRRSR